MKSDELVSLTPAERADAEAFLALAKGYTATEVARVLTDFQHGVNYMGCGKAHCARVYAEALAGKRAGLATTANRIREMTLPKFAELLKAERERLEERRQRKMDNEARWAREAKERAARHEARTLAADRWQALETHDLLQALQNSGRPVSLAELTAIIDEKLAERVPA